MKRFSIRSSAESSFSMKIPAIKPATIIDENLGLPKAKALFVRSRSIIFLPRAEISFSMADASPKIFVSSVIFSVMFVRSSGERAKSQSMRPT